MIDDLAPILTRLPEPTPPATLTATVMAHITREADRRSEAEATVPAHRGTEGPAWLWTVVGLALVMGVSAYGWLSAGSMPDLTSARIGPGRPDLMPLKGPVTALLGLGLLVYLAGLFAPLRSTKP